MAVRREKYMYFNELNFNELKGVYWVIPSERGRKDGVFQGLAGRLQGISRAQSPREIPRSRLASPRKNLVHPNCFSRIYILCKIGQFGDFSEFFIY